MEAMLAIPEEPLGVPVLSEIRAIVEEKADEFGVDKALAVDLATFESGMNPEARSNRSSATGLYQFISKTFEDYCTGERTNPVDNAGCAMKLISEGGISHWLADENTKAFLIRKGYVECSEICGLKPHLLTKR